MTYTLFIWTVVTMAGDRHYQAKHWDWKPLAEFHYTLNSEAQDKCQLAAQQLGLKEYRCIKTK